MPSVDRGLTEFCSALRHFSVGGAVGRDSLHGIPPDPLSTGERRTAALMATVSSYDMEQMFSGGSWEESSGNLCDCSI